MVDWNYWIKTSPQNQGAYKTYSRVPIRQLTFIWYGGISVSLNDKNLETLKSTVLLAISKLWCLRHSLLQLENDEVAPCCGSSSKGYMLRSCYQVFCCGD